MTCMQQLRNVVDDFVKLLKLIVSPAVNFTSVLFVPAFSYFTYKVLGSVPSVASTPITFAVTPEVAPVNVKPTKSFSVTPN